ncbi:hypothetical protein TNCV_173941 [Trichonephila clavipes]|nr:hypothetical protein TNCV_173941 [Trichonephila clavipes]
MFTHLSLVTLSSSRSEVTTDIHFTLTMSGFGYPKGDKESGGGSGCFPRDRFVALNPFRVSSVPLGIHPPLPSPGGTATAGSDVVQSGRPIFDDFFQHLWPYIGNNTANVVFQMVKRLWLIRIDQ